MEKIKIYLTLSFAVLFTSLFYEKLISMNLFIFEILLISAAILIHKPSFKKNILLTIIATGTLVSLSMIIIYNSDVSKVLNIISFICLIGAITYPKYTLISSQVGQYFSNIQSGLIDFFNAIFSKKRRSIRLLSYLKIIVLPILVILVFLLIYYNSNDYFAELMDSLFSGFSMIFDWIPQLNFILVITFLIGVIIAVSAIYSRVNSRISRSEENKSEILIRKRNSLTINNRTLGLKNEYKSGVFLLIALNLMLLVFNYSDISKIWFSYEWNGDFLRDFVHSGTYLLIVSLVLSIIIVLYYFRKNINFYKKNKLLKILTYIWLTQNFVLVISLFIRNSIYIQNFALAYKRIGVYLFLIATCILLYTIFVKVIRKKSFHYLFKINSISIYTILILNTTINWDVIIAKYNVDAYQTSFVEMEFLLDLSNKALPYIDLNDEKLNEMREVQSSSFSFKSRYISDETYKDQLEKKKHEFISLYPKRNFLEWNYADYKAYSLLTK